MDSLVLNDVIGYKMRLIKNIVFFDTHFPGNFFKKMTLLLQIAIFSSVYTTLYDPSVHQSTKMATGG